MLGDDPPLLAANELQNASALATRTPVISFDALPLQLLSMLFVVGGTCRRIGLCNYYNTRIPAHRIVRPITSLRATRPYPLEKLASHFSGAS
mmetsp:Transcript_24541/g.58318  ORF Transcript_24541/g.58318 Transcript_24541/m.58318 type:complete len:92 (-) Transcript_24541:76-351(-)